MVIDHKTLDQKKQEIHQLLQSAHGKLSSEDQDIIGMVERSFIKLTPPTETDMIIKCITASPSGFGDGYSRKPGNIVLNWAKLANLVPDIIITVASGATAPSWLLFFICLDVWNKLWCNSKEELTEVEAIIICSLWQNRNHENKIPADKGFAKTNTSMKKYDRNPISRKVFENSITRLVNIGAIELESGVIWLREWVRVKY